MDVKQQVMELRSAVLIEAHDLAIKQNRLVVERVGDGPR
jgi:hypothetical protein